METALVHAKARCIKLVLTDSDGVLTDNGVYYSAHGEEMKQFSIRDGMGVERLRNQGIATGIITGETSPSVVKRAHKLRITELHLGVKDKAACLQEILTRLQLTPGEVAFIGDDTNDVEIMGLVGLAACPSDATDFARHVAHYHCTTPGGHGCFRELAELIIASKSPDNAGRQRVFIERQLLRSQV
ncbi:KdsC family phosphatase [Hymenobacter sp. B1770]|uniref:KdsC family phosphatase n=1 Tax=Hymenobacter sp. B1770 TaxID=1718788 RepID=UPI003CEAD4D3